MENNLFEAIHLGNLPRPVKLFITMFMLVLALGYLLAIANIQTTMGLNYDGIVNHYLGSATDKEAYPGMDLPTLTSTSHTHVIAMSLMVFCLGLIFIFTKTWPKWLQKFVLVDSFVAVIIAVGSFWFIKYVAAWGAYLMMFSGMLLGTCVFFETVTPLYEMWIKKRKE